MVNFRFISFDIRAGSSSVWQADKLYTLYKAQKQVLCKANEQNAKCDSSSFVFRFKTLPLVSVRVISKHGEEQWKLVSAPRASDDTNSSVTLRAKRKPLLRLELVVLVIIAMGTKCVLAQACQEVLLFCSFP